MSRNVWYGVNGYTFRGGNFAIFLSFVSLLNGGGVVIKKRIFSKRSRFFFYALEGTLGGILKSRRPSIRLSVHLSVRPSVSPSVTIHRKIKHNKRVCHAHDLGSYAQGQGHTQVRGQNRVSAITQKLLKQI